MSLGLARKTASATLSVTLALAGLTGLAGLQVLGAAPANAAQQNGYVFNDTWQIQDPGSQTTKYTPAGQKAATHATSSFPLNTGAVAIDAKFVSSSSQLAGTNFITDGSNQSAYGATAGMLTGAPDPASLPALGLISNSSTCGGDLGTAGHQNLSELCPNVGTLTLKFSKPVTDPVLDITGIGGQRLAYQYKDNPNGYDYARGSFNNTQWVIATDGVSFTQLSAGARNMQVAQGGKRLLVNNANADPNCNGNTVQGSGTTYQTPAVDNAGCGSVTLNGTFTEVTFQIDAKATPFSQFAAAQYGTGSDYFQNDGTKYADGVNGDNVVNSEQALLPRTENTGTNSDLQRFSLRLPQNGSLGDKVWKDDNGDGIQDANEPGVSGVTVQLLDADGQPVNDANGKPITTTTDSNGNYKFSDLPLGTYKVKFSGLPADTALTKANQGTDDTVDSDADPATGVTGPVTLTSENPENLTLDAGIVPVGSLGDKVWRDDNGDGIQDPNEPGISGVKVELLDKDGNPVKDANGNPITTTTDAKGNYLFKDLPMGDYKVKVDLPAGTKATTAGAGSDRGTDSNIDPNGLSDTVSLTPENPNRRDVDAGIIPLGSLGDKVWRDDNADGIQDPSEPGVSGVKVELLDKDGNPVKDADGNPITTTTDANGNYKFSDLPMGDYKVKVDLPDGAKATTPNAGSDRSKDSNIDASGVSDVVTLTPDNPNNMTVDAGIVKRGSLGDKVWRDDNGDGIQDPNEPGISGVKVELLDKNGNPVKDANGNPITTTTDADGNYKFTDLSLGDYKVKFDLPQDSKFTQANAGTDQGADSDADPATGVTGVVSLTDAAPDNMTVDAGIVPLGSLGDKVWRDDNGDGVQDPNEPGVSGVKVELLDKDGNPVKDANGNPITTTTDKDGNYLFKDLPMGDYKVKVNLPAGTKATTANSGDDRSKDSNIDPNGVSDTVSLTPENPNRRDVDAGIVPLGSLGDKVWRDDNGDGIQDPNEPGVSGVKVELLDKDGNPVKDADGNPITTTTDQDGNYKFTDLPMGDYKVKVDLPEGTKATTAGAGSDRAKDSNIDPNGVSDTVSLTPENPNRADIDAGVVPVGSLGDKVWRDDNGDGIQDPNEPGVSGVKVELLDKDGNPVKDADGNPITTTTDKDGNYLFTDLPMGDYKVKVDLPEGTKATTAGAGSDRGTDSNIDPKGVSDTVSLTPENPNRRDVDAGIVTLPSAQDDESLNNQQGTTVTVPTLKNDKGDLDPATVKITDPNGKPVSELVVPGEGKWTVDPKTGDITFAPEKGFTGNPTPINYTVKDKNGNETGAKVTITYVPVATEPSSPSAPSNPAPSHPGQPGQPTPGHPAPGNPADPGNPSSDGDLAYTGAGLTMSVLAAGAVLFLGGAALLIVRRRRQH